MRRRDFLRGAAAAAAGAAAGAGVTIIRPGEARAFGETPKGAEAAAVPEAMRAESVLEIFLYGGVSQYESFYCVPEHGAGDGTQWHAFLSSGEVLAACDACSLAGPLLEPFAPDALGNIVHLGPFAMPLRARPDVVTRTRISITSHDLEPHEAAIPLALAGRRPGHPALAGLGAHVQRHFMERKGAPSRAPFSYVLLPSSKSSIPTDNVSSALAIGAHPGAARPLSLKVDAASELSALLAREEVGAGREAHDALVQRYVDRYRGRLRWRGEGDPLRSPRAVDLAASAAAVANAEAIAGVLPPSVFVNVPGERCGEAAAIDAVAMSLRVAAHLLTHPTAPAKYVCVIDGGFLPADGGGGYDTHFENSRTQARNLSHTLRCLLDRVNAPGEGDPFKIDLDKTMIVLTTEFGRSPHKQGNLGRNHWPYGYPIVTMGGPLRAASRGVFGAVGPDARAKVASTPLENRIAALLALGIWPFAPESYSVSDVPGAASEAEAAALVKKRQLGIV